MLYIFTKAKWPSTLTVSLPSFFTIVNVNSDKISGKISSTLHLHTFWTHPQNPSMMDSKSLAMNTIFISCFRFSHSSTFHKTAGLMSSLVLNYIFTKSYVQKKKKKYVIIIVKTILNSFPWLTKNNWFDPKCRTQNSENNTVSGNC